MTIDGWLCIGPTVANALITTVSQPVGRARRYAMVHREEPDRRLDNLGDWASLANMY
jgi:hypothetical protein